MNTLLNEIILQCAKREIPVYAVYNKEKDALAFKVHVGSKTGEVLLKSDDNGFINVIDRYNKTTDIMSFDGLASIAFGWYLDYRHREPFTHPDSHWEPVFLEMGYIKVKETVVKTYEIQNR